MRLLYLVALVLLYCSALAQEKEIIVSEKGVRTNVGKSDVFDPIRERGELVQDSLLRRSRHQQVVDSIAALQSYLKKQTVFSQKQWKNLYDSLSNVPFANIPALPSPLKKEVTEEELLEALKRKFSYVGKDSLSSYKDPRDTLTHLRDSYGSRLQGATTSILDKAPDLNKLSLPSGSLIGMMPLPSSTIPTKYLNKLDSIRALNLASIRLKLNEKESDLQRKVVAFTKKPSFLDRSYFEGVIGFSPGKFSIVQASPTLGYHFSKYLSLGAGPNVLIRQEDKKIVTTVGIKTFFKAEFMKRRAYFQLEDIMDSYGAEISKEGGKTIFESHNVFVGGGFLLTLKSPVSLNLSILYCVTENKVISHEFSPLVFRIGLSSLKLRNK